jgi:hypothetical protein
MSQLGDFLKIKIEQKMDYHKRSASGEAVRSLREVIDGDHLYIYGIDYWEEINNGIPAGTRVGLDELWEWVMNRSKRYPNPRDWGVGGVPVQKAIFKGRAAINSQPDRLHITKQVLDENRREIARKAQVYVITQELKLRK